MNSKKIKYFFCFLLGLSCFYKAKAQKLNWQNLDLKTDSIFGISTDKAYNELLRHKTPTLVIVAVIDAGVDTNHEDLKAVLWNNTRIKKYEGPHGWSFIGSDKGNVHFDNLELTRQVRQHQAEFEGKDSSVFSGSGLNAFHQYVKEKAELQQQLKNNNDLISGVNNFGNWLKIIEKKMAKENPTLADFQAYQPQGPAEEQIKKIVVAYLRQKDDYKAFKKEQIDGMIDHFREETDYELNVNYDPRPLYVGDDYFNSKQRNYGSPDVMGPDATHGTHVAGIIAAVRDNNLGINGIANDVRIMVIRAVPEGDERDKDIANAIRFAADHGAKVINMSFGKEYSQDKKAVDDAVKYALKKDVLLVQAAGNDDKDLDQTPDFPNRNFLDGKQAASYIVVGASGWKNDSTLKAPFSNYGKQAVDVFAPGEQITSCIPGSKYAAFDGTSMACPVVAGLAALVREYYPKLSAVQVKEIILESVVVSPYLKNDCRTGGVVNVVNALSLAAESK